MQKAEIFNDSFLTKNLTSLMHICMKKALSYKIIKSSNKKDGTLITEADKEIDALIKKKLYSIYPGIPIISEEGELDKNDFLNELYWLVDPIDGTSSYAKKSNGYTINLALIHNGNPIIGFIAHPPSNTIWYGLNNKAIVIRDNCEKKIQVSDFNDKKIRVVLSKSKDFETKGFLKNIPNLEIEYRSSSIKFCRLAEGKADMYPRLQSINKWDIAAGDAILRSAGGTVLNNKGMQLKYNTSIFETGLFFAVSSKKIWDNIIKNNIT
tara:strand:- start:4930 stop:5727 length:798 start_codon:yes stop_codon:yes gene_type:complete